MMDLSKISTNGRAVYVDYTFGLSSGIQKFNSFSIDPETVLGLAAGAGVNGIVLHRGVAEKYYVGTAYQHQVPLILKLNARSMFSSDNPFSPLVCTVQDAIELGASAVEYTVHIGSGREDEGLAEFAEVVWEAHQEGIAVVGSFVPAIKAVGSETTMLHAYCARMGLDLGADVVRLQSLSVGQDLSLVVRNAGRAVVVFDEYEQLSENDVELQLPGLIHSGAFGYVVGAKGLNSEDSVGYIQKVKAVVLG